MRKCSSFAKRERVRKVGEGKKVQSQSVGQTKLWERERERKLKTAFLPSRRQRQSVRDLQWTQSTQHRQTTRNHKLNAASEALIAHQTLANSSRLQLRRRRWQTNTDQSVGGKSKSKSGNAHSKDANIATFFCSKLASKSARRQDLTTTRKTAKAYLHNSAANYYQLLPVNYHYNSQSHSSSVQVC